MNVGAQEMPAVSVVIPSRNRPVPLTKAVSSALNQTFHDIEVIVILDGPDEQSVAALKAVNDERLRVVSLSELVGGAEARNVGIREARGAWIALLDDDDEWMPEKLAEQMQMALAANGPCLVVTRYIDRGRRADIVHPKTAPTPGQHISDYLFCGVSWLGFRGGFLQTSTWLAPRSAFLSMPFTKGLTRNQDTDWLLRAVPALHMQVLVVWNVLSIFHNVADPGRVTAKSDWRYSINWAVSMREYFTPRAFSFFVATVTIYAAKLQSEPFSAAMEQFKIAKKLGALDLKILWLFFATWFIFPYGRFGMRSRLHHLFR